MSAVALNPAPDRRAHPRKSITVPARVSLDPDIALDVRTVDLSLDGISLISGQQLNCGQECAVQIGIGRPGLLHPLTVRALVCYCISSGPARFRGSLARFRIGLRFTGLSAEELQIIEAILA